MYYHCKKVEVLSDYEIWAAFSQINREIYALEPAEIDAEVITRFTNINLTYLAGKPGWAKSHQGVDGGYISYYHRQFLQANIAVEIGGEIDGCCFYQIHKQDSPNSQNRKIYHSPRIRLGEVNPLVISEVLRDLTALANQVD